ncbi:hypothetical protein MKZ08_06865 [Viridibacillus sp. FSL R5-0477]|uniref:Uncharacterized protein n=2 Tax=Viridibacillus TaxID=496496 RepID=W4ENP9_9BACL|nr:MULTISPECIES: hypothetical protein [Viridibacillus]ETT82218.1 hypothetical protein C176_14547 [Viridibacillus arenosi FSL R5-213]OMC83702.1 hypothetical protein BK128_18535 [Viridibacillus sp. FSL H7-0596]OMC85225.1 hypothetical protein BK130_00170 [Viridibacillus sp. FSL H8-0123]OMC92671.1 hypothetical protein BK137_06445 [Viridibacillus arenosi]
MTILFYAVIMLILLMFIQMAIPALHRVFYTVFFFLLMSFLLMRLFIPFLQRLLHAFPIEIPYLSLILGSAFIYFVSTAVSQHLNDQDYEALAFLSHTAVKLVILSLWLKEIIELFSIWQRLIEP